MNTKFLVVFAIVSVALFSPDAYAAFTVTPSLSSKSLTENEQAAVTVSVKNLGGSAENNVVVQLVGGWFSVITECPIISSLQSGQTGTTNCIIKPTSTGSGLSLTATAEAGSSTGTGSETGISVISQSSSITATISSVPSVSVDSNFYAGVTVTAPPSADATNVRPTVSVSGSCSVDTSYLPAEQNLGTITGGTAKSSLQWKITSSSSGGTCAISVNVVSDSGGNANPAKSVAVSAPSTGTTGSSGSGGAGGGGSSDVSKDWVSIAAGETAIMLLNSSSIDLTKISFQASESLAHVRVSAAKLSSRPSSISADPQGKVYQYISISAANITGSQLKTAIIEFRVSRSWMSANGFDNADIVLNRYSDTGWKELITTPVSSDSKYVYFSAATPGFSFFAISGRKNAPQENPAPAPPAPSNAVEENIAPITTNVEEVVASPPPSRAVIYMTFAIIILGGAYFYYMKKKGSI